MGNKLVKALVQGLGSARMPVPGHSRRCWHSRYDGKCAWRFAKS